MSKKDIYYITRFKHLRNTISLPIIAFDVDTPEKTEVIRKECYWEYVPVLFRNPYDSEFDAYKRRCDEYKLSPENFDDLVDGSVALHLLTTYIVGKKKYNGGGFSIVVYAKVRKEDINKKGEEVYEEKTIAESNDGEKIIKKVTLEWEVLPYRP